MPISLEGKIAALTQTVTKIHIINFVSLNKIIAGQLEIGDQNADIFVKNLRSARAVYKVVTDKFLW